MPRILLPVGIVLVTLALVPGGASAQSFSGPIFVDATGVFSADLRIQGVCETTATLVLTIHRSAGDDVRTVEVSNLLLPDLCSIACLDCPVPFAWSMTSKSQGVALEGGGMAGFAAAFSMQGPFQEGALEFRGASTGVVIT